MAAHDSDAALLLDPSSVYLLRSLDHRKNDFQAKAYATPHEKVNLGKDVRVFFPGEPQAAKISCTAPLDIVIVHRPFRLVKTAWFCSLEIV